MARFTRVATGATWGTRARLKSSELNTLDTDHTKAPNFDEGSTHSPAADIEMTGNYGIKLMGTSRLKLASRTIVRVHSIAPVYKSSSWTLDSYGMHTNTPSTGEIVLEINNGELGDGQLLDALLIRYKGGGGHSAFPPGKPGTMPTITLRRVDRDGTGVVLGENGTTSPTVDGSTSNTNYQAAHDILIANIGHTLDLTQYRYLLEVDAESGANYQAGAMVTGLLTSCIVTSYSEP